MLCNQCERFDVRTRLRNPLTEISCIVPTAGGGDIRPIGIKYSIVCVFERPYSRYLSPRPLTVQIVEIAADKTIVRIAFDREWSRESVLSFNLIESRLCERRKITLIKCAPPGGDFFQRPAVNRDTSAGPIPNIFPLSISNGQSKKAPVQAFGRCCSRFIRVRRWSI